MSRHIPSLVALATYQEKPELTPDDALLVPALEQSGARVAVVPWTDPAMDWSGCAGVVIRSTWDYHLDLDRFVEWTDQLEGLAVPTINSAPLLRWNAEKSYLRQLESAGVDVVPTRWLGRGDEPSLLAVLQSAGWEDAVVKPVVSASAYETWRTSLRSARADEARFRRLVDLGEVMVQPFLGEIETEGEWSLVFLGDRFSHAVVKRPKPGDFRVQKQFGGSRQIAEPDEMMLEAGRRVLDEAPGSSVYARIDGCVIRGRFTLMELELIEPELFLGTHRQAPQRFAGAIMEQLNRGRD